MNSETSLNSKKILVTGGNGFLGKKLCPKLVAEGAEVIAPTKNQYDLRNYEETAMAFTLFSDHASEGPDIVIHLAATVGGIGATAAHPGEYFYDNMQMGLNVIEASRDFGVQKIVVAGSVCAYPKNTTIPMLEKNLWDGKPEETNAPYGISKRALLAMLEAYYQQYGLKSAYLLMANLYGPGDDFSDETSHVIPALIKKFINAKINNEPQVVVWGTGTATRDFLYVSDAAYAFVLAAKRIDDPAPINIATGNETRIAYLAERIKEYVGYEGEIVYDTSKPDGQPRRCLRIWEAKDRLGWKSSMSLDSGLRETIRWYQDELSSIRPHVR